MYYVIVKNSSNKKAYVSSFKDKEDAVSNIIFRFNKKLNSLHLSKHDIRSILTYWDYNKIYNELLNQNYEKITQSKEVTIMYDLFDDMRGNYIRQQISWQLIFVDDRTDSVLYDFMLDPRYKFKCVLTKDTLPKLSDDAPLCEAAYIHFENIGVEFEFCIKNGENHGFIYKTDKKTEDDLVFSFENGFERDSDKYYEKYYYPEIDFENPNWKSDLEMVMCRSLIKMHHLNISFTKENVDDVFCKIIGMRFSTVSKIKNWILEKLRVTKEDLPDFILRKSEINDEIVQGKADVDYVFDGTFGKGVLEKSYSDFSISYLITNNGQIIITDAHWN